MRWGVEGSGTYTLMVWKWYRLSRAQGRMSPPADDSTVHTVIHLCNNLKPENLQRWEPVPFPSPMHSSLDWIYTVDIDAGTLTISSMSEWRGLLAPSPSLPLDLAEIYETYSIDGWTVRKPRYMFGEDIRESNEAQAKQFETFEMDLGIPSPMNELQGRFFTDLVFVWRFWIDDPSTWRYNSPVFRVLCAAFLRLAAWDFEVSFDSRCSEVELPIDATSIPLWSYPDTDIYWFHGYLVVLQENLQSDAMINKAISKAKSYIGTLDTRPRHGKTRLICISLRQVVFVELSQEAALASKSLVLLSSSSATQCSPGFRALARVLTSNCWKPHAYREKWPVNMPPEIIEMIFSKMEPGDAVAFSQAFSVAEQCYYASEFQFKNIDRRMEFAVLNAILGNTWNVSA
ncbi:hypothetical protein N7533_012350 [Penicillium manginii]|uniref:uncharacterized protein n=1 Tax=Penicillium manginii TaxID=203109 RepID=UPI002548D057|nr:uncharacterized protein N7533_012350 [Penicillium manginii]KAJ5739566.1 hypothetical protein N7533_012350 [Penicillium manginii]